MGGTPQYTEAGLIKAACHHDNRRQSTSATALPLAADAGAEPTDIQYHATEGLRLQAVSGLPSQMESDVRR